MTARMFSICQWLCSLLAKAMTEAYYSAVYQRSGNNRINRIINSANFFIRCTVVRHARLVLVEHVGEVHPHSTGSILRVRTRWPAGC
jgi:hypothetical protein